MRTGAGGLAKARDLIARSRAGDVFGHTILYEICGSLGLYTLAGELWAAGRCRDDPRPAGCTACSPCRGLVFTFVRSLRCLGR